MRSLSINNSVMVIFIFVCTAMVQDDVQVQAVELQLEGSTRTGFLSNIPWFRSLLRVLRPNPQAGRKSDYRSELDANYVNYRGSQLWKIALGSPRKRRELLHGEPLRGFIEKYGTEVWNINQDGVDILIDNLSTEKAKQYINATELTYNIMIDDIDTAIDETYTEVNNTHLRLPWLERESTLMSWDRFHGVGDIQQYLQHILDKYPDMAEIVQIGLTTNKRTLEVLRFSNGNPNNWAIFVDAGFQGRDWLSPAALTYAIAKLTWFWNTDDGSSMRNIDWYFLPVINPDGYQYSRITDRLWSKNRHFNTKTGCYGVSLDRNFEYQWGGTGSSNNPCKNLYYGSKEFSEPETRAMRSFLLNMKDYLGGYISFSGYGQAITYPWGDADYVTDNQRELHRVGRKAMMNLRNLNQAEYRIGTSYRLKLARSGNSADWVQHQINPQYVYNVFLKDQGRYGYLMPPHYIIESGEEAYEFMKTVAEALR